MSKLYSLHNISEIIKSLNFIKKRWGVVQKPIQATNGKRNSIFQWKSPETAKNIPAVLQKSHVSSSKTPLFRTVRLLNMLFTDE